MKNAANIILVLAIVVFVGVIVMKLGFHQDITTGTCIGCLLLSSGLLLKKKAVQ